MNNNNLEFKNLRTFSRITDMKSRMVCQLKANQDKLQLVDRCIWQAAC